MGVIAIIAALLIEQWRPLGDRKSVNAALGAWAGWLEQSFNGGERRHGTIAWLVALVPAAVAGAALHAVFYALHPLLALAFNIAALYVTLGFRQFSHHLTATCSACFCGMCCCPGRAARSSTAWRRFSPRAGRASAPSAVSRSRRSTCSTGRQYG